MTAEPAAGDDLFVFNGVAGETGTYLHDAAPLEEVVATLLGSGVALDPGRDLAIRNARAERRYALERNRDVQKLSDAGWGLVSGQATSAEVIEALRPLCDLRRSEAGDLFRVFAGADGVQPGEDKREWLLRHDVGPGPADPTKVPYYLLLVGGPDDISFGFQHQLDVAYAVGRVAFDTLAEYAAYAARVVAAEASTRSRVPRLAVFGPRNNDDKATALSATLLAAPLGGEVVARSHAAEVRSEVGAGATKERLIELLCGEGTPDVLFTATHGLGFRRDHPLQRAAQGALVCQEWPGPLACGERPLDPSVYVAADDIPDDGRTAARVVFAFACYGAGTPLLDDYAHMRNRKTARLTSTPFVARLPQRLLARGAGALAVIGHVERAWGYSFAWPGAGAQRGVFSSTLASVLDGVRVGHALDYVGLRSAEISVDLTAMIDEYAKVRRRPDPKTLASLWVANNDARGYALLGDPAVRLARPPTVSAPLA